MNSNCSVSVVMTVYNGENYIATAIESILNQTYQDFEFIIVNDGSTDKTKEIIKRYKKIELINQDNQGISKAANNGIMASHGEYIARLDADDIAITTRIEKQINFLEQNPEVGLLGSGAVIIDSRGHKWGNQRMPQSDAEISWTALFKNPFIHSSIMFRRRLLGFFAELYDPSFTVAGDHDLWVRMLHYTKAANIPEPLVYYRFHPKNISTVQKELLTSDSFRVTKKAIDLILPQINQNFKTDEINEVRELLISGTRGLKFFAHSRSKSILDYVSIWEFFKDNKLLTMEENKSILKQLIIKVCQMTFFPPFPRDTKKVIQKLTQLNKFWLIIFLRSMPYALNAFIRERFIWKRY